MNKLNLTESTKLYKKACGLMPAGVNSPVRSFSTIESSPFFADYGKGSKIYDIDGNEYIDFVCSWGPLILGHANPEVLKEINKCAQKGVTFGTCSPYEVKLSELILQMIPSIEMIRFVNSGTEATMSALRLARAYTGRDVIIKFNGHYHGHSDHLLTNAGSGIATNDIKGSAGVPDSTVQNSVTVDFNDIEQFKQAMDYHIGRVAAVIMEPIPCNMGLVKPEKGFIEEVKKITHENGSLLIFDEVITGFRVGPGGAQEYLGIEADLVALGKIIGGGLPVGAYAGKKKIMEYLAPLGPVYQAGTLSGNPLAMAAGVATLEQLKAKDFYASLEEKGKFFESCLDLEELSNKGIQFNRLGPIFSFFFTYFKGIKNFKDVKTCDMKRFKKFHQLLLNNGIFFAPSPYEVGFISSVHSNDDLEKCAQIIKEFD